MKNKGSLTIDQLIKWIVVVVVLVIIGMALWMFYTGQFNWGKGIPIPGQQNLNIKVESATFRYLPASDKVEYYTGTVWEGFTGKNLDIIEKRVKYDVMKKNFYDYYFAHRDELFFSLPPKESVKIYDKDYGSIPVTLSGRINILEDVDSPSIFHKKGNVIGVFVNTDFSDSKNYGQFLVDAGNRLYLNKVNSILVLKKDDFKQVENSEEPYRTIVAQANLYRDSVLKKPVALTTGILKGSKESGQETKSYCPEKINYQGEISLVVRLEEPTKRAEC